MCLKFLYTLYLASYPIRDPFSTHSQAYYFFEMMKNDIGSSKISIFKNLQREEYYHLVRFCRDFDNSYWAPRFFQNKSADTFWKIDEISWFEQDPGSDLDFRDKIQAQIWIFSKCHQLQPAVTSRSVDRFECPDQHLKGGDPIRSFLSISWRSVTARGISRLHFDSWSSRFFGRRSR